MPINIMKIPYIKATKKQFARAKAQAPYNNPFDGRTYQEILKKIADAELGESRKSYDRYGRLTLVGEAKRKQDLIDRGLSLKTTLKEFLEYQLKWRRDLAVKIARKYGKVKK